MENLQIPIPETFNDELKSMIRNVAAQAIEEAVKRETTGREWMNQKEACEWLGISFGTMSAWRKKGLRVAVVQGKTLLSKTEINRFLEEHSF